MDELRNALQGLFREVFADDSIVLHDTTTAADVDGWDSLMHINIVIAVEKHFGIRFATAEISRLKGDDQNVGTFLQVIARKLNGK